MSNVLNLIAQGQHHHMLRLSVTMNSAGRKQNSTFRKFYDKPVQGKSCFQSAILGN